MNTTRKIIEDEVLNILIYIENKSIQLPIKQSIKLLTLNELEQLLNFLKTWNYKLIYDLLDKKYKEHLWLIEELKNIKIKEKMIKVKQEESNEKLEQEKLLNTLLNF